MAPKKTKAAPARAASETRSRGNGSPIDALKRGLEMQSQDNREGNPPTHRGFVRTVLRSTTGTAPITFVRTRDGVRIELEDGSAQVYFVADVAAAMRAVTLAAPAATIPLVKPTCPRWCDRAHGPFFSAMNGQVQVQHVARRGTYELVADEVLDLVTGMATTEAVVAIMADDHVLEDLSPADLAARLRLEAQPLHELADLLDGGA